ncbi:MAG: glycosyltransferase family 2 protein [Bacteroidia bacterium]|nr:glycosyltransferase family 2 protein [Bacteroidia bacterium]MDW8348258.1 glycosyltransferase family 2 protein [Bacteroidia bacterium]
MAIITKNEEKNIIQCLRSVQWASEIVVVDSGSSDSTISLAQSMGAKVFYRDFDTYGDQKQYATNQCTQEWVLSIDADERIPDKLALEIEQIIRKNPKENGFYLTRVNFLYGKRLKYGGVGSEKILRLFRKSCAIYQSRDLHEYVAVQGKVGYLKNYFEHHSIPDLNVHWQKIMTYTDIEASRKPKFSFWRLVFLPWIKFIKLYILKLGFLDGYEGYMWAKMSSLSRSIRTFKAYQNEVKH